MHTQEEFTIDRQRYDSANEERLLYRAKDGISEQLVREISKSKNEPEWMLQKRLKGFELFLKMENPTWGPSLEKLDLSKISYFLRPDAKKNATSWDDVPDDIKNTFDKLGIPKAEREALAGVGAQYDSETVYHNLQKELQDQGVVFIDCDEAVHKYPDLVKKYFMTSCVPMNLHRYSALHAAVWSGGTFIYIPKGVKVEKPLQAYFRMNARKGGQFEHTLIIVDEGAEVSYIEGCFGAGTQITTNPDYKPIEQIRSGEKILTSEGEFKHSKDIQAQPYTGKMAKIQLWGDTTQTINVTQEHPFLYVDKKHAREKNKQFTPRWNMPAYFQKGDYLCMPINQVVKHNDEHTFVYLRHIDGKRERVEWPVQVSAELFRLIGYYLAQGSVSSNAYLNFSFHFQEREYIEDVKRCLKKVFGIKKILEMHHKKNNGTSLVVCSVDLARIFKEFGKSANTKSLPAWVIYEKPHLQKELIKGWFRGDGNYFKKKTVSGLKEAIRINTVSEKLAKQARDLLLRQGIVSFINSQDRQSTNRQTMYTIGIGGEFLPKMGELVGISISKTLNGKKRASMFGIDKKFAYIPIRSITFEQVTNYPVYNFGVTDHQTFTAGGVAVHNCSAPVYTENSLHAGCVEIHVLKGARARYSSIENWSKNTYNLNTKRAVVHDDGIIEWINGNLGCLTDSSKVFTNPRGPKNISAISPGDKVLSYDFQAKKIVPGTVKQMVYNGDREIFEITAAGRSLEATQNHPFLTLSKTQDNPKKNFYSYQWKPLSQLQVGDMICVTKNIPNKGESFRIPALSEYLHVQSKNQYASFSMSTKHLHNSKITIPKKTNPDLMWLLGLLIGDGFVDVSQNKINIATHYLEDYRESQLIRILKEQFNYTVTEKKERFVIINSKKLCELFTVLGVSGTAKTKRIPNWVYTLPEIEMEAFLGGYFDADGHVQKNGAYLTSCNKSLLEDFRLLAIQLGYGISRIFKHMSEGTRTILGVDCIASDSFRLLLSGEKICSLDSRSKKKKAKLLQITSKRNFRTAKNQNFSSKTTDEIGFARIDAIIKKGIRPTFDIEVEKYHNFIANGLIVHNSGVTMLYPGSMLMGDRSKSDFIGIALANKDQNQDTGCKIIHIGEQTSSTITSKSISLNGGISTYRGLVSIRKGAKGAATSVECDALMIDNESQSNTYPYMDIHEKDVDVAHEATVGKISEEQIFYLMSRGLSEEVAKQMIVSGFIEPIVKELPLEYAVELNKLIELEMEGNLG
ncbi:MAG: SufD family Fe-S cluster assembly protein [Candidatus Woesearchaeota archaeon]